MDTLSAAPYQPTMPEPEANLVTEPKSAPARAPRDDLAYIAPMAAFLGLTWLGANDTVKRFVPHAYVVSYAVKTVVVAMLLAVLWRQFTKVRWNYAWLGAFVGVVGIFQWVPMQLWLQQHVEFFKPSGDAFVPTKEFATPAALYAFIALRLVGAVMVVPAMEELFWRDFLWRQILAPNDFKLARIGEWSWAPFLGVSVAFAFVHGNWWLTSIVWALMIGGLLIYTKSLGACIVAHAVTNLLLGVYVLYTRDWGFW